DRCHREDSRRTDEPAGWGHSPACDRTVDATDNALRRRVSPGGRGRCNRVSRQALREGPLRSKVLLERSRSGSLAQGLDGFFQFFGCSESDFLAGPNLNRLAGRRVAPHAGGSFSNLQYAEPRNSDSFTLLQMLGDQTDEVVQEFAPRAFRQLVFFGQACAELGERNRNVVCHVIPLDTRINPRCWEEI